MHERDVAIEGNGIRRLANHQAASFDFARQGLSEIIDDVTNVVEPATALEARLYWRVARGKGGHKFDVDCVVGPQ